MAGRWTPTTATRRGHAAQCLSDGATPFLYTRRRSAPSTEQDLTRGSGRCHVPAARDQYGILSRSVRRSTDGRRGCRAAADDSRVGLRRDSPQPHPHMRLGRYFRYRRSAIEAWIREIETGPDPATLPHPIRTDAAPGRPQSHNAPRSGRNSAYNVAMAKRDYGTGHLYIKQGSYFGRWRGPDGRLVNRKVGPVRSVGARGGGLTRVQAERELRRIRDAEELAPRPAPGSVIPTVDEVTDLLRQKQRLGGARRPTWRTASPCSASTSHPASGHCRSRTSARRTLRSSPTRCSAMTKLRKPSATSSASSTRSSSTRSTAASCARTQCVARRVQDAGAAATSTRTCSS